MKKKSRWPLILSGIGVGLFLSLMVYAMSRDANALPSQLVGKTFPTFESETSHGSKFVLSEVAGKGRWVVLNFWSSSCIVCREEAPELERFYRTVSVQGTGPYFVSVNIQDTPEVVREYAKNYGLSYPIVEDRRGAISLDYGVTGTPETFFVDPSGVVRHRVAGEVDGDSILRFVEWLEKNPSATSLDALKGFAQVRSLGG